MSESGQKKREGHLSPSWVDQLVGRVSSLPGPTWLAYLTGLGVIIVLNHAVFWIDGVLRLGAFDRSVSLFAFYAIYWLALYHYLTGVSSKALQSFRPLLDMDQPGIEHVERKLTQLPRHLGLWLVPFGFVVTLITLSGDLSYALGPVAAASNSWLPVAYYTLLTTLLSSTFFALFIRTTRQLVLVGKLHQQAVGIDLLDLEPPHAFSALTARAGTGMIVLLVINLLTSPYGEVAFFELVTYLSIIALALAVFVVPLEGMHARLQAVKERELRELNDLLRMASSRLHDKIRSGAYEALEHSNDAIATLLLERERVQETSTWPWNPGTIRGFSSTLLLPIFLLLVTRLIERLI